MRVIFVTHDSTFGRYVAASLYDRGLLDRIVVETGRPGWRYYWRKLRRVGPANAVFQMWLNRWFRREGRWCLPNLAFPPHATVADVNRYPFGDDLVIGFGTSVITARTLGGMSHGFLNLHTGWLPDYRGVKSEFWTLLRGGPRSRRVDAALHDAAARRRRHRVAAHGPAR
jgi:methionyl-tRNA formyltransferase